MEIHNSVTLERINQISRVTSQLIIQSDYRQSAVKANIHYKKYTMARPKIDQVSLKVSKVKVSNSLISAQSSNRSALGKAEQVQRSQDKTWS